MFNHTYTHKGDFIYGAKKNSIEYPFSIFTNRFFGQFGCKSVPAELSNRDII